MNFDEISGDVGHSLVQENIMYFRELVKQQLECSFLWLFFSCACSGCLHYVKLLLL